MALRKTHTDNIDIEEVFLDGRNILGYHRENLEGALERPITKKIFFVMGILCTSSIALFALRTGSLQVFRADAFRERSTHNYLRFVEQPAERGLIYDRDGKVLAANEIQVLSSVASSTYQIIRRYPDQGFLHVLGFLRKDNDIFWGASGIEEQYDASLRGVFGKR